MEESGLLTRKVFPEVPPHTEYTLTETGYSLKPILDAMEYEKALYGSNIRTIYYVCFSTEFVLIFKFLYLL